MYGLKMKTSRAFFSEMERRFDRMPFTLRFFFFLINVFFFSIYCLFSSHLNLIFLRAFEDEVKAKLGVIECAKHELLQPFTVLQEKEGKLTTSHDIFYRSFWVVLIKCVMPIKSK